MGVSTVTAARILKGQLHHSPGEETRLEMDKFPFVALSKVSSARIRSTEAGQGNQALQARESALLGSPCPPWGMGVAELLPKTLF